MPAILSREAEDTWLNSSIKDNGTLLNVLKPYPDNEIEYYPVSTLVNSAKVDSPECIVAVA